jgi:hypothetical protein
MVAVDGGDDDDDDDGVERVEGGGREKRTANEREVTIRK